MRLTALAMLAGAALAVMTAPAEAAWNSYVSHSLGFSVEMPGTVKSEVNIYGGEFSGPQETIVFRSVDGNIKYEVTVFNYIQAKAYGATLLGEVEFDFQNRKKLLMDTFARIESGKDWVYGRKITIDLPNNGGRSTGAFYFNKGYLYWLQATVPANGDYATPDIGRFIDSLGFVLSGTQEGATELQLPN